jgi:hypothetical protein
MTISAKFKVSEIVGGAGYQSSRVRLVPDYAQGRNKDWAAATPSGVIEMYVGNETAALKQFVLGQAFTVLFEANEE